jgi:hypothetical protein
MKQKAIRQVLLLALFVAIVQSGCAMINHMSGISETRELQKMGQPAQGVIKKIWDSGMTLNNDPVVWLQIEVHPEGGESFEAKTKCPISRLDVPQFQPGQTVPVRYDPKDHSRIALDVYEYK